MSTAHYHTYERAAVGSNAQGAPALELVRDVWALVTKTPQLGMQPMGRQLGVSSSQISRALRFLRDAGYIEFQDRATATRRVVVPFFEVRL